MGALATAILDATAKNLNKDVPTWAHLNGNTHGSCGIKMMPCYADKKSLDWEN